MFCRGLLTKIRSCATAAFTRVLVCNDVVFVVVFVFHISIDYYILELEYEYTTGVLV